MKKFIKKIIYIILSLFLLIIITIYGFVFIDYYFFNIKPEYNNLTKKELNDLKEKTTLSKSDLLINIDDYNNIVEIILNNNIESIFIDKTYNLTKINYSEINNNNNININIQEINSFFIKNKIENIGNKYVDKGLFDNGIIFIKENIRMERGRFFGYLYYEGEIPSIIYNKNANYKKDIIIKINDNWLMFDIQYIYN